jgi:hypothetical protein
MSSHLSLSKQIDKWLAKHDYPRLTMPVVCGYIPLTRHLIASASFQTAASASVQKEQPSAAGASGLE